MRARFDIGRMAIITLRTLMRYGRDEARGGTLKADLKRPEIRRFKSCFTHAGVFGGAVGSSENRW
jgi:hypothetical protein